MESVELGNLEMQVDYLLKVLQDLRSENKYLRNQIARYAREKSGWYQNNREIAVKIKKIIGHLHETII